MKYAELHDGGNGEKGRMKLIKNINMVKVLLSVNPALFGASLIYTWRMKL